MSNDAGCLVRAIGFPVVFLVFFNCVFPEGTDSTTKGVFSTLAGFFLPGLLCVLFQDEKSKPRVSSSARPSEALRQNTASEPIKLSQQSNNEKVEVHVSPRRYIPKNEDEFEIRGIDKGSRGQTYFNVSRLLQLVREPNNAYDKNAIAVCDEFGNRLAYVAKETAGTLAPKIDAGWCYDVENIPCTYVADRYGCCYVRILKSCFQKKAITCPLCHTELELPVDPEGHNLSCGKCGARFTCVKGASVYLLKCAACDEDIPIHEFAEGRQLRCPRCHYVSVCRTTPPHLELYPWFERSIDAGDIRNFARERGIRRVLHFTSYPSLKGIFETGQIMSRVAMDSYRITHPNSEINQLFHQNDAGRWDMRLDCINTSIERINTRLLWTMQQRAENANREPWCILVLDAASLEKTGVLFTVANAASKYVRLNGTRAGIEGLKAMFAQTITSGTQGEGCVTNTFEVSRYTGMAANRPTDSQAEVLIPGSLPVEMISEIIVASHTDLDTLQLMKEQYPSLGSISLKVDSSEFNDGGRRFFNRPSVSIKV